MTREFIPGEIIFPSYQNSKVRYKFKSYFNSRLDELMVEYEVKFPDPENSYLDCEDFESMEQTFDNQNYPEEDEE